MRQEEIDRFRRVVADCRLPAEAKSRIMSMFDAAHWAAPQNMTAEACFAWLSISLLVSDRYTEPTQEKLVTEIVRHLLSFLAYFDYAERGGPLPQVTAKPDGELN